MKPRAFHFFLACVALGASGCSSDPGLTAVTKQNYADIRKQIDASSDWTPIQKKLFDEAAVRIASAGYDPAGKLAGDVMRDMKAQDAADAAKKLQDLSKKVQDISAELATHRTNVNNLSQRDALLQQSLTVSIVPEPDRGQNVVAVTFHVGNYAVQNASIDLKLSEINQYGEATALYGDGYGENISTPQDPLGANQTVTLLYTLNDTRLSPYLASADAFKSVSLHAHIDSAILDGQQYDSGSLQSQIQTENSEIQQLSTDLQGAQQQYSQAASAS